MRKQIIPWVVVIIVSCIAGYFICKDQRLESRSTLTPNWNYSSVSGLNTYQWLASSFVFVIKRPPNTDTWEHGEGEYALSIIQRGNNRVICPSFSGLSVIISSVDLDPFVGQAVLVTAFTRPDDNAGINIERIELDAVVNDRMEEYRAACPFPFQKTDEAMGVKAN